MIEPAAFHVSLTDISTTKTQKHKLIDATHTMRMNNFTLSYARCEQHDQLHAWFKKNLIAFSVCELPKQQSCCDMVAFEVLYRTLTR